MGTKLSDTIRAERARKRWTQDQLAEALGVTRLSVSNWENGIHSPRAPMLRLIEIVFDLPPNSLKAEKGGRDDQD